MVKSCRQLLRLSMFKVLSRFAGFADPFEVDVVFVDLVLIKGVNTHLFKIYIQVDDGLAFPAFKMAVDRRIRIVAGFIFFDNNNNGDFLFDE